MPAQKKMARAEQIFVDWGDEKLAEARALLGSRAYVDLRIVWLPDGGIQVACSVGLEHADGYRLQQLGSGMSFYEAIVEASAHKKARSPLRHRTDELGRAQQRENAGQGQSSEVLAELARTNRGR